MATQPLFVGSSAELKANLRLSGLDQRPDSDANELLEQALRSAIVRFYSELSEAKIAEIQATAFTEQPTSKAEAVRMLASLTEIRLVRAEAMRLFSVRFADGAGGYRQDWNEEAPLIDNISERDKEINHLLAQVEDAFGILSGADELEGSLPRKTRTTTIGPCNSNFKGSVALPGGTVFPVWPEGAYIPIPAEDAS